MAAPQMGTHFLPFSLKRAGQREGAHGGAHPSLRHCPHISAEEGGRERPELRASPIPTAPAVGCRPRASLSSSLFHHSIFMCPSSVVCSGLGGHGTCYSWPMCAMATSEMLVESRITLGWDCLLLFDLQDGRVGLHDGHDDPVNVVLQAEVDLFLLLNRFHELIAGD